MTAVQAFGKMFTGPVPAEVTAGLTHTADELERVGHSLAGIDEAINLDVVTNGTPFTAAYASGIGVPTIAEDAASVFAAAPASIDAIKPFLTPEAAAEFGTGPTAAFTEAAAGVRLLSGSTDSTYVATHANGFATGARNFSAQVRGIAGMTAGG